MASLTPDSTDNLSPETLALVGRLAQRPWSEDFYLAGSAAMTLYSGHRSVRDLDLMGPTNRLAGPDRRDLLEDLLRMDRDCRVETARDGYMFVRTGTGIGLRLFYYPYPLIEPEQIVEGLHVASLLDLALMKLGAIISRGTRRDFVDLFLICREIPLAEILDRSSDKFGHVRDFQLQALKGLADLSLIEGEPMPKLDRDLGWPEIERWLRHEVHELGRDRVGLGSG